MKHLVLFSDSNSAKNLVVGVPNVTLIQESKKIMYKEKESNYTKCIIKPSLSHGNIIRSENVLKYLTFEALEDNSSVYIFKRANPLIEKTINLSYSLDAGNSWINYEIPKAGNNGIHINLNIGELVIFKGDNLNGFNDVTLIYSENPTNHSTAMPTITNSHALYFLGTGKIKVFGNALSLIYNDEFIDKTQFPNNGCFARLFQGNTSLIEANVYFGEICDKDTGMYIYGGCSNLTEVTLDTVLNKNGCSNLFYNCVNLEKINKISELDTSNIISLIGTFCKTYKLKKINISNWDTSKVLSTYLTFESTGLESIGNITNWDVSKVQDMSRMFAGADLLTGIGSLKNWDVSNVTEFGYWGDVAPGLNDLDCSNWDTSKNSSFYEFLTDFTAFQHGVNRSVKRITCLPRIHKNTETSWAFVYNKDLTTIKASNMISKTLSFDESPLTYSSVMVLLNALDPNNPDSLTLSDYSYNLLSESDKLIATNKGWTLINSGK